nr:LacI family DNA-binding transcriptional regulator [uncultured Lachnoanaerobaculum sp.]
MNIYDIANRANVSIATVSRVINDSPKVSEKTRKKIHDIMEELGYTPNVFARGLGLNTMKTIGILCSDPSDIYVARALSYFEKMLRENGYDSLLCCSGYDTKNLKKYINILISKSVDAVIMIGSKYISAKDNKNLIKSTAKSLPIFLINGFLECDNVYCSYYDDFNATKISANMLYNTGKRNLLFLYNSTSQSAKRKLDGFISGCKELKIKSENYATLLCEENDIESIYLSLEEFTKEFFLPDGIIASDDFLAMTALKFAKQNSISVPDELSIIGYDNSIFSKISYPELTTVDSRLFDLCGNSVKTLLEVFDGQSPENICILEPSIIERDTFKSKN